MDADTMRCSATEPGELGVAYCTRCIAPDGSPEEWPCPRQLVVVRLGEVEAERDDWKIRCQWWEDMTGSIGALIDGYFLLPRECEPEAKLRQVATEIKDTLGYDWMTAAPTDNQRLAERAEAAEARITEALALVDAEYEATMPGPRKSVMGRIRRALGGEVG